MTTAKPTSLILSAKPRRWYRRRTWQILLLLLTIFISWFTWAILAANDRQAIAQRIVDTPDCSVHYGYPEWFASLEQSSWLPESMVVWIGRQVRFPEDFYFGWQMQSRVSEELLAAVASRSWPSLRALCYSKQQLWTGNRLLLPLRCPELNMLMLHSANISDDNLIVALRCYPKLYSLDLSKMSITGKCLANLDELPELAILHLDQCDIENLNFLSLAPRLNELYVTETNNSRLDLTPIRFCPELEQLRLDRTSFTGSTLASLQSSSQLKYLSLDGTLISDADLKFLPALPSLEIFSLSETKISGATLFVNGVPSKLVSLDLSDTQVQWKHISRLKGNPGLTYLHLDNTPLTDEGSELLGTLPALHYLSVDNTKVGDKTLRVLLSASTMVVLSANHTDIADPSGAVIRQMPRLERLHIGQTAIGNRFLAALSGHPTLEELTIHQTSVNDQGVPSLLTMPKLATIHASPGQFSPKAVQQLKDREIEVMLSEEPEVKK